MLTKGRDWRERFCYCAIIEFEIKSSSSILCLSFVYIRFFSQYSELEQVVFIAKRLQERYRVRNLYAFILNSRTFYNYDKIRT